MLLVDLALIICSLPTLACSTYLLALTLFSARRPAPPYPAPRLRVDAVVPAHNEQTNIASTVTSLLATDYPSELRRVVVVADNCTDATAEVARAAGATVLVRDDASKQGKGYALAFAFERFTKDDLTDVVVVVDADTTVSANLLRAFAARFEAGAEAVQAEYGVRNRGASWRTRLMAIALAIFHGLRSLARERFRVSCGLRGNGMGFTRKVLKEVPHDAFSIVEDVEYGIRLGRAGHRVWYVGEAEVRGEMVATERESRSQRRRWEGGRRELARRHGGPLFAEALRRRSAVLLDLALDLVVPPLSLLAVAVCAGTVASAVAFHYGRCGAAPFVAWGLSLLMIAAYVARGVVLSGAGVRGFIDLAAAPAYVGWKLVTALRRPTKAKETWVRTARRGEKTS
jgi:1,2-diacylglycerol 3-beta-glucosyltransferase